MRRSIYDADLNSSTALNRLEALTDGVFSIAMTLLVITIKIPDRGEFIKQREFVKYLLSMDYELFSYCISFFIIAFIWVSSIRFMHLYKNSNDTYLLINFFNLLFITFIPITTSLMSNYGNFEFAEVLFHSNILALRIVAVIQWEHLLRNTHLIKEHFLDNIGVATIRKSYFFMLAIPVIGIVLSIFTSVWSNLVYLTIFFKSFIVR